MKHFLVIIFSSIVSFGIAQLRVSDLHYVNRIEKSKMYMKDVSTNHSSILPKIYFEPLKSYSLATIIGKEEKPKDRSFIVYPLSNLAIGYSSIQDFTYTGGMGLGMDYSKPKLFITAKFLPYYSAPNFIHAQTQLSSGAFSGGMRSFDGSLFFNGEVLGAYKINKFFTTLGGFGKNFFGEGYRSLLLSDNAGPQPFAKLETKFGPVKYVNLFQLWTDNTADPLNREKDRYKFSATHYLSWNITRDINLSVFETVVWQRRDTIVNRGLDFHYLNPFVFYRSVEYGIGSADNVLLGANISGKINANHQVYTQILLDEFLLSAIRENNGWWGNKFGFQLGYKSNKFFNKDIFFQTEFNAVRPFTYSHKFSTQNYGHLNSSVTHPLGANFYEALNIVSFKWNDFRLTNKLVVNSYGVDTNSVNYGQNIFASYSNRDDDYGHDIGQGLRKTVFNESIMAEYPLIKSIELNAFLRYNWRYEWQEDLNFHEHFFTIGIRSRIWNAYDDF